MDPTIVQVDSLVALKDEVPGYVQNYDLSNAQFFRLDDYSIAGPFNYIVEVACFEDCYFAWKKMIGKMEQQEWPKARDGPSCLSDTDANEIFGILAEELYAWCVKKCAGMSWVKIEAGANVKTEVDIKTEVDDSMEFGIKAEVKVKTESET
ncbi:hypothetical protein V8C34DRAFT_321526 [Trichoderma compactum]